MFADPMVLAVLVITVILIIVAFYMSRQ